MRIEHLTALADHDREPLVDFWVRAWTPVVPDIDFAARRGWLFAHLASLLTGGACLLLIRHPTGTPAAFLTLHPVSGEIDQLAVDPDVASQGLGRALMDEAKRHSPGHLFLRVVAINTRAARFYAKAGFIVTGETVSERAGLPVLMMAWPAPP